MKLLLATGALLTIVGLLTAAGGLPAVSYVGHAKVAAALARNGTLVTASDLIVMGSHRAGPGQVELHEKETDVFYVTDGEATFVTGGSMIAAKVANPGQLRSSDMRGGQIHHLSKGDIIVIPAGTPHWFKEVPLSISYYVVKVLKQ